MDAGKRHQTPGSETKDNLLHTTIAVARVSAFFFLASFQTSKPSGGVDQRMPEVDCVSEEEARAYRTQISHNGQ